LAKYLRKRFLNSLGAGNFKDKNFYKQMKQLKFHLKLIILSVLLSQVGKIQFQEIYVNGSKTSSLMATMLTMMMMIVQWNLKAKWFLLP
jgi:hypothetical protein